MDKLKVLKRPRWDTVGGRFEFQMVTWEALNVKALLRISCDKAEQSMFEK